MAGILARLAAAIAPPRPHVDEDPAGLPWELLYPSRPAYVGLSARRPGSRRSFTGTGASQLLSDANADRTELTIYNGAGVDCYIALAAIASSSSYTVLLAAGGTYVLEEPDCWQGAVAASWGSGTIQVTEANRG